MWRNCVWQADNPTDRLAKCSHNSRTQRGNKKSFFSRINLDIRLAGTATERQGGCQFLGHRLCLCTHPSGFKSRTLERKSMSPAAVHGQDFLLGALMVLCAEITLLSHLPAVSLQSDGLLPLFLCACLKFSCY